MATYVLVHGAWHGSWCWKRVRAALTAQGHGVFTPTLTGVGERSHLLSRDINLDTHIADVVNLIRWEELSDIILCGHSYGGCVIRGAANQMADRIKALVYLDAFLPENGQSLHDCLPAEQRQAQIDGAGSAGDGWKAPPISAEAFGVNAKDRDWVNRQCTVQSLATFQQPVTLSGAIDRIKTVAYILATGWQGSPFGVFYDKAAAKGWRVSKMDCGHDVMLDRPEELTRELLAIASA